ncbi:MAG: hypothetical protein AB2A00_31810 [Myxococcota bacterium]
MSLVPCLALCLAGQLLAAAPDVDEAPTSEDLELVAPSVETPEDDPHPRNLGAWRAAGAPGLRSAMGTFAALLVANILPRTIWHCAAGLPYICYCLPLAPVIYLVIALCSAAMASVVGWAVADVVEKRRVSWVKLWAVLTVCTVVFAPLMAVMTWMGVLGGYLGSYAITIPVLLGGSTGLTQRQELILVVAASVVSAMALMTVVWMALPTLGDVVGAAYVAWAVAESEGA